ncbi:MAG: zinc ribbon domain-containing protein [Chloroflexi bacterium]|nr:zinc ribbon domain-containing protein [Chloroflexota bacterium]
MAKKTIGYLKLQWTCPNCGGINPGPEKTCISCGSPQPEDVQFQGTQNQELLTDDETKVKAEAGADTHCPYCESRNPSGSAACAQCGGDLSEGALRKSGHVVGAYKKTEITRITCPSCGADNLSTAAVCGGCGAALSSAAQDHHKPEASPTIPKSPAQPRKLPIALIIGFVLLCIAAVVFAVLSMNTEAVSGVVQGVEWQRTVAIEVFGPVEKQDWYDEIPSGAEVKSCNSEVRSVESEPAPNAQEICGTPYTVDTGSGYGEVVQDCEYHIYEDYCTYTTMEWQQYDTVTLSGGDYYPQWPNPSLPDDQRLGDQSENFSIFFDTNQGDYNYQTGDFTEFQQFTMGSTWQLNINSFGSVLSVEP